MYDPEDERKPPTTWREYLDQSKEMFGAIKWAWREFKTPQALRWYRRLLTAVTLATVFSVAQPKLLAVLFDGTAKHDLRATIIGVAGFFFCLMMQRLVDYRHGVAREWLLGLNMGELDDRMTERFFEKSIGQHVEENFRLNPESIMTGRERLLAVQSLLFFEGIPIIMGLGFSYVLLWVLSPVIGLVLTGFLAAYGLYVLYLNQKVLEACSPIEVEWRRMKRYRFERMKNVERVKTSGKELDELRIMKQWFADTVGRDLSFWLWYLTQTLRRGAILIVGLITVLIYGIVLVWTGRWMIGALIPLVMWSLDIVNNVWRIGHIERQFNWYMPAIRHMIEALSIPPAVTSKPDAVVLPEGGPVEIVFDAITHTYPLDGDDGGKDTSSSSPAAVIRNVAFSIGRGERVALIGPSGAGKTTLMKLLLRFMDPDRGAIRVNGHDLRDIDLSSWMRSVAYIPQHAQILDGTIRYNLEYGLSEEQRGQWTDDRLWELMRKLCIDFGERLTDGLETVVGERGMKLSGGQAQRIMIGAAAIQHPPFMIIDEATSHLDSSTERAVHHGLSEILSDDVGALIIAHRLSTVRNLCDKFVVLRNAEEVRNGDSQIEAIADSFEELYAISPTFRHLADDQHVAVQ
ncbi:MAG: ABC transporter ATP-binding protein [Candidatus Pacebacteria bacterium]|nr:ABC transporter ATP-binding protein [Candidatus Paceibacterota bacterium]